MIETIDWIDTAAPTGVARDGLCHAEPGWTVHRKYEVLDLLGRGGMGTVWLVRHRTLGRLAALKMIPPSRVAQSEVREHLRREAAFLALFSRHRNAVAVYDARADGGDAYIEMEYIRGRSLDRVLVPRVPMALRWIDRVLPQLMAVLQFGHEHGVVHGDLKPSNVMLETELSKPIRLRVLDFGLATALGRAGAGGAAVFSGTPAYASPEQVCGEPLDGRSDLYSVGVLLYEFLTGYRPFGGPLARLLSDVVRTEPPPFRQINPGCDVQPAVESLILACLAKDPARRPATADELLDRYRKARRGC